MMDWNYLDRWARLFLLVSPIAVLEDNGKQVKAKNNPSKTPRSHQLDPDDLIWYWGLAKTRFGKHCTSFVNC